MLASTICIYEYRAGIPLSFKISCTEGEPGMNVIVNAHLLMLK